MERDNCPNCEGTGYVIDFAAIRAFGANKRATVVKYKAHFPITVQMSPIDYVVSEKPMESKEEEALWHYNRSRAHDGLRPLHELPEGVRFELLQ
jgi:hypothetical protein